MLLQEKEKGEDREKDTVCSLPWSAQTVWTGQVHRKHHTVRTRYLPTSVVLSMFAILGQIIFKGFSQQSSIIKASEKKMSKSCPFKR